MQVDVAAVPPGISLATAEAVLFIGKAARVLRQPPGRPTPNTGHRPYQALASRANSALQPFGAGQAGAARGRVDHERDASAGLRDEAGLAGGEWEGMRQRWATELRRLAAAPAFSALDFERTVEGIRTQARQLPCFKCLHYHVLPSSADGAKGSGSCAAACRPCKALCKHAGSPDLVKPFLFLHFQW